MTEEFKEIIDEDIRRGKEIIEKSDKVNCNDFHKTLISKYSPIINSFDKKLYVLMYDENKTSCLSNIKTMVEKLELFKAMGYRNMNDNVDAGIIIHNNNTNSNTIDISISFEQARKNIEDMTALTEAEVEEILSKMDELEEIVQSKDRKTKKWDNAKGIIKWVADKGVDVALTFLPLLMQIG